MGRWLAVWMLLAALTPCLEARPAWAQPEAPVDEAWLDEMLADMTTADKVGQLFLVTFPGSDVSTQSDVARLIQVLRIGGVILDSHNGNLVNDSSTPTQIQTLTQGLQELAFTPSAPVTMTHYLPVTTTLPVEEGQPITGSQPVTVSTVITASQVITTEAQGIPLLIAVAQEGDGYPHTTLRGGFSPLASNMALGATWDEELTQQVGQIVGQELAAVGVNLLLGPSLDVLAVPRPGRSGDLGTRAFGGDPYWVGRLGQAYIEGIHTGSDGRVAVVAKHLPGLGASDRSLEQEIATVDKSLQDLRLIELPPFFAVTQSEVFTDTADALMTAHIRYRGFQGNIRYVTPPISLHSQGLQEIMAQPELVPWRKRGGLLVSDSLGVPAVRRYYSPDLTAFPHRQIALDAFQAGNDLLTLSRFSLNDSWDAQMSNIEDTILFFQSRYKTDDTFRLRVDDAVRRILRVKHRLCDDFTLASCSVDGAGLAEIGNSQGSIAQVAQESITLLYPSLQELAVRIPRPPRVDDQILIFTDAREAQECDPCVPFYLLEPEALEETILRMYGPEASGQVNPGNVNSFTFAQLRSFLSFGTPNLDPFIRDADWILFAMLDYAPDEEPSSGALKQFLRDWTAGLETQNIVVMAYEAPYYLDTTEVSKLTTYYGVYSKSPPFVRASIRALFQEFTPVGRSPVTVEGVGYYLTGELSPDPNQIISVIWADQPAPSEGTPQPIQLDVGGPLKIRTSVIVDHNGHAVPDGTPVIFRYVYVDEGLGGQVQVNTVGGVAETTLTLEHAGLLEIRATSDPARNSLPLQVIKLGEKTEILTPTPTPTHTPTPTPTSTPTPTPTDTPTPTPSPTPTPEPEVPPVLPNPRVEWIDLALALVGMMTAGGLVWAVGAAVRLRARYWNPALRIALWSLVCGLVGYLFYGLALPGSGFLEGVSPGLRGLMIGFGFGLAPLAVVAWLAARQND
jgi:beta-N-acetylhexosaminidase